MPEQVEGLVELWDGWCFVLPNACMSERNADSSWSAWDALHTVDVHILTVGATEDGKPMDVVAMLGEEPNVTGAGWRGFVENREEGDEQGPAFRTAIAAASTNSLMSCWIAYRDATEREWADRLMTSIAFTPTAEQHSRGH